MDLVHEGDSGRHARSRPADVAAMLFYCFLHNSKLTAGTGSHQLRKEMQSTMPNL